MTANLMNALTGGKAKAEPRNFMPFMDKPKANPQLLSEQLKAWAKTHNERPRKTSR